jgi:hypothetical protein
VLQYPLRRGQTLIEQVQARKKEIADLVEGMTPELDVSNPATTMPLMRPERRQQFIENVQTMPKYCINKTTHHQCARAS